MKDKSKGWRLEFDTIWDESFTIYEYDDKVPVYKVCNKMYQRLQQMCEKIDNK